MTGATLRRRNARVVLLSLGLFAAMSGLVVASVPLYRLFCQVTGYGGTTRTAVAAPDAVPGTAITVRLDANVNAGLPWRFFAEKRQVTLALGEIATMVYRAENLSDEPVVGTATFNVTPFAAGPYFNKIQCFCFVEQRLGPGASAELPVTFFVDPAILEDPEAKHLRTITLSYTFFRTPDEGAASESGDAAAAVTQPATDAADN
jgi:cytochrome c oxidase assembly protein subunit 11